MNVFQKDNTWQLRMRDRLLAPFYSKKSKDGRFVFADKGVFSDMIQREMAIDTLMQIKENGIVAIEEKMVRWPGYEYKSYTLEINTCTVPGRERKGWMYYSKCDVLLYCFVQENNIEILAHALPFRKLHEWFFSNEHYKTYRSTITDQINKTECKIVPIAAVWNNIHGCKKFHISEDF